MTPHQIPKEIKQYLMLVAGTDDIVEACRMWTECGGEDTPKWRNGLAAPRWMVQVNSPDELLPVYVVQSGRLPNGFEPIRGGDALKLLVAKIKKSGVHIKTNLRVDRS